MKYRLTENSVTYRGKTLYQIEALKDFQIKGDYPLQIKKGELGGYIEKESNLSQTGNCWITEAVYVLDDARVENDALIDCQCVVRENSRVFGRAWLSDERIKTYQSDISGQAKIYGDAESLYTKLSLSDNTIFCGGVISGIDKGHIYLRDNAEVRGGLLHDNCQIYDNAIIYGGGIHDNVEIGGNAKIYDADICDNAKIEGNVEITYDTNISGNSYICGNAVIERDEDVMTFSNIGTLALLQNEEIEDMKHLTFFRAGDKMQMTIGNCFYDDPEKFLQHIQLYCQHLQAILEMAEERFGWK